MIRWNMKHSGSLAINAHMA